MAVYDVFNGDADGICALLQLRSAFPKDSELVTGVKRDIQLLKKVHPEPDDQINVLDVSMDKNKGDLQRVLDIGAHVFYCDHHRSGDIPSHPNLDALINTAPDICTSLLVNSRLKGSCAHWAVVGAFGDNLKNSALSLAKPLDLSSADLQIMENLGVYINYNGYGADISDLHFSPEALFRSMSRYKNPLDFIDGDSVSYGKLEAGYIDDMARAKSANKLRETGVSYACLLPNEKWARRVSGVYGNALANESPDRAHAVITEKADGTYLISVRAPLNNKDRADELCSSFPTGGGRKAAAGINALPGDMLDQFLDRLESTYQ